MYGILVSKNGGATDENGPRALQKKWPAEKNMQDERTAICEPEPDLRGRPAQGGRDSVAQVGTTMARESEMIRDSSLPSPCYAHDGGKKMKECVVRYLNRIYQKEEQKS